MPADRIIQADAIVGAIAFTSDGASLAGACGDGKVRVWEVKSGTVQRTLAWDEGDRVASMPPASDILAAVGKDGQLKTWNLQTGKVGIRLPGSNPRVGSLTVSPDRRYLVSSNRGPGNSSEEIVHIWETDARERVQIPGGIGGTSAFAISPDSGVVVAGSYDANVRAWNAKNGELLALIEQLPVAMFAMAFSPDGKTLATAGADRTVYLWDAKTWKLSRKFTGQREMISALAWSPNGKLLLTGGFNAITVKHPVDVILRDVASGKPVRTVGAAHRVTAVAFAPSGQLAAFTDGQKQINLLTIAG
jgi:WD40 repeat protein